MKLFSKCFYEVTSPSCGFWYGDTYKPITFYWYYSYEYNILFWISFIILYNIFIRAIIRESKIKGIHTNCYTSFATFLDATNYFEITIMFNKK